MASPDLQCQGAVHGLDSHRLLATRSLPPPRLRPSRPGEPRQWVACQESRDRYSCGGHLEEGADAVSPAVCADCVPLPCPFCPARAGRRLRRFRRALCRNTGSDRPGDGGRSISRSSRLRLGAGEACRLEPAIDTRAAGLSPGEVREAAVYRPTERADPDGVGRHHRSLAPRCDHRNGRRVARGGGTGGRDPATDQDPVHSARWRHPANSRYADHSRGNARCRRARPRPRLFRTDGDRRLARQAVDHRVRPNGRSSIMGAVQTGSRPGWRARRSRRPSTKPA